MGDHKQKKLWGNCTKALDTIRKDDDFKEAYKNFKDDKNKHTYAKLVKYLNGRFDEYDSKIKNFALVLTGDNNFPIYNSKLSDRNTFKDYKNGRINYTSVLQTISTNNSEINGKSLVYNSVGDIYVGRKIGSALSVGSDSAVSSNSIYCNGQQCCNTDTTSGCKCWLQNDPTHCL